MKRKILAIFLCCLMLVSCFVLSISAEESCSHSNIAVKEVVKSSYITNGLTVGYVGECTECGTIECTYTYELITTVCSIVESANSFDSIFDGLEALFVCETESEIFQQEFLSIYESLLTSLPNLATLSMNEYTQYKNSYSQMTFTEYFQNKYSSYSNSLSGFSSFAQTVEEFISSQQASGGTQGTPSVTPDTTIDGTGPNYEGPHTDCVDTSGANCYDNGYSDGYVDGLLSDDFNNAMQEAYEQGYNKGFESYEYSEKFQQAIDSSYNQAVEDYKNSEDYSNEVNELKSSAYQDGVTQGVNDFKKSEEYENTIDSSFADGFALGKDLGYDEGVSVTYPMAKAEGFEEFRNSAEYTNTLEAKYQAGYAYGENQGNEKGYTKGYGDGYEYGKSQVEVNYAPLITLLLIFISLFAIVLVVFTRRRKKKRGSK